LNVNRSGGNSNDGTGVELVNQNGTTNNGEGSVTVTPPPVGGGGGGENNTTFTGPVGGGGDPTFTGPVGGGSPTTQEQPTVTQRPQTAGVGGGMRVGTVRTGKPKSVMTPWLKNMRIPWAPACLPAVDVKGYSARVGSISDALKLSPADGGWSRDGRPVVVFSYDATSADHKRLLSTLDHDSRVRTATNFFNCFRVDVAAYAEKNASMDATLAVYLTDGTLVGELSGQRKMGGVYDLLEKAWKQHAGAELTKLLPGMEYCLKEKAVAKHYVPLHEVGIVCPDCGGERLDIIEKIAALRARSDACDRAMESLKAKN
jgi:hypothetical protein